MNITLPYPVEMPIGTLMTTADGKWWRIVARPSPTSYVLERAQWWKRLWWRVVARFKYIMDLDGG